MTVSAPLHLWRRGTGVPLVLIHGFAGHGESWADVAESLDTERPVLSLTLPGHDPACGAPRGRGFEETVDAIASFLKEFVGTPFEAAGYSMGGRVALGLLARRPGLVSAATLIGANPGIETDAERAARLEWEEGWAKLLEERGIDAFTAKWEALPLFATQAGISPERLDHQRSIRLRHDPAALAQAFRSLGLSAMPDYRPELAGIAAPVRLVTGERDAKFLEIAIRMKSEMARAETFVAPRAGHNVVLERPDFLAKLLA